MICLDEPDSAGAKKLETYYYYKFLSIIVAVAIAVVIVALLW